MHLARARGAVSQSRDGPRPAIQERLRRRLGPPGISCEARTCFQYPGISLVYRGAARGQCSPQWAEAGTPQNAYDVHQPGFRTFAAQLILDVVARYDIDGVNLDYIRAMGVCTSEFCQAEYRERNGKQLLEDYAHAAPDSSAWLRIQDWQDSAVGALVRDIAGGAREIKPALTISIDGFAVSTQAQRPLEAR